MILVKIGVSPFTRRCRASWKRSKDDTTTVGFALMLLAEGN